MIREFIIFPEFENRWQELRLTDKELRQLELFLCMHPESGDIIPGTGGLRKLRFGLRNKGKKGGARIIYIDFDFYEKIYLITAFPKNTKIDLT